MSDTGNRKTPPINQEYPMINRAELENKLVHEIHTLPIEAIESLLQLTQLIKHSHRSEAVKPEDNFVDFIRNSPLMNVDIDLTRDLSLCRDLEL